MTSKNTVFKTISVILIIVLLFSVFTVPSLAISNTDQITEQNILFEIKSLRTENTKIFKLNNGNNLAHIFDYPIHYKDKNGIWQETDNSLIYDETSKTYINKLNDIDISIPTVFNNDSSISVSKEKYSVEFNIVNSVSESEISFQDTEAMRTYDNNMLWL